MERIVIRRRGTGYEADLMAPDGHVVEWTTPSPMSSDSLIAILQGKGCHPTDIGDAFYEADPEWLLRPDGDNRERS